MTRFFLNFARIISLEMHRVRSKMVRCRRKTIVRLISFSKSIFDIVYDNINTICAIIQQLFRQNKLL